MTLKRIAYGFRDDHYFNLSLLALHDFKFSYLSNFVMNQKKGVEQTKIRSTPFVIY